MKWYAYVVLLATVLSLTGLGIIVAKQDPFQSGKLVKTLFFGSSFVSVWGIATIIFFLIKKEFAGAFRRGIMAGIIVIGVIVLNRSHLLSILSFSIVAGIILLVEIFLTRTYKSKEEESWT